MKQHRVLFLSGDGALLFLHGLCRKGDDKMLLTLLLAFILIYVNCWKKEIKEFKVEKEEKEIKKIRKSINIDIQ